MKKISVVGVYRAAIPSEKFSSEWFPLIEVSNLLCYLFFTQINSIRPSKVGNVQLDDYWFRCVSSRERNRRANCCSQGEKFTANERSSFGSLQKVSIATIQWENILETVNIETTKLCTRPCNGAFSLSSTSLSRDWR